MGLNWAEHSTEIAAPIETSFDAIVDYESFPRWQNAVDSVEVLTRTKDGLGEEVHLFVDAKVRKIDYVLRYRYDRPREIRWDFLEGNGMRDVDGTYTLESLGPDRCRATYDLGADPAIPVPGPVARRVHKQLVKRSVEDLKREAERRHAAGEGAKAGGGEESGPEKPRSFRLTRRTREPAEAEPARTPPAEEWTPKAERAGSSAKGDEPAIRAIADLPETLVRGAVSAATNPVKASRDLAGSALRAGRSVAGIALELGKDAADRIDRALSGRDDTDRDR